MKKDERDTSLLGQKENATFRAQRLGAVPSDLLTMHNLLVLDLSHNRITRFPGDLVVQDIPRLEVLHLQHNLLYVLEDILALSVAPRLRELHVSANPLRLLDNRIYFLEVLLSAPSCDVKALRTVHKDPALTAHARSLPTAAIGDSTAMHAPRSKANSRQHSARTMALVHKLPRKTGFPMLQKLNGLWLMDDEIRAFERERGRSIEYFGSGHATTGHEVRIDSSSQTENSTSARKSDGSRMTAKELVKMSMRSASIPSAAVIERFQIDVETNGVLKDDDKPETSSEQDDNGGLTGDDTRDVIHRLFGGDKIEKKATTAVDGACTSSEPGQPGVEGWNYPIRSFDTLTSDDRQYIRHRSKQSVESNLQRDDHFFDSSVYLDCIAQAERSRRLTMRAVDTLCPLGGAPGPSLVASQSAPTLRQQGLPANAPLSTRAVVLRDALSSRFSKELDDKQYDKLEMFVRNPPPQVAGSVDDRDMQAALSEFFLTEHMEHRQHIRHLLDAHENDGAAAVHPLDAVASQLDDSLSKTKLRNAVDLANALLLNKKQEKRMMEMLIEADAKAIEHERASLEQALHRHRLDLIASNTYYANPQVAHEAERDWMDKAARHTTPSPWQARNWRAKEAQRQVALQRERDERENEYTNVDAAGGVEPTDRPVDETEGTTSKTHRRRPLSAKSKALFRNGKDGVAPSSLPTTKTRPTSAAPTAHSSAKETIASEPVQPRTTRAARFRSIETVEQAARDPLDHVPSHDLLVRCAAIRQHTDAHTKALAQYRDQFLDDEAAWEAMRQDPINIVRRHLRRKLYQDAQEIQIAGTQLFYSSLFQ